MSAKRHNTTASGPKPLDPSRLEQLALAYVARFATTQGKLRDYLQRKLRERGWEDDVAPAIEGLVARFAASGYVDDAAWAQMKAGSLTRRGYGARRIGEALRNAGIAAEVRKLAAPGQAEDREAAAVFARRRRFGPWSRPSNDEYTAAPDGEVDEGRLKSQDKQLAAMLRAGHSMDNARFVLNAPSPGEVEEWVGAARMDDVCE